MEPAPAPAPAPAAATSTTASRPRPFVLLRPPVYLRILGCALLFIALVDLLTVLTGRPIAQPPGVRFDWTHEAIITAIGVAALVGSFGRFPERSLALAALVFGASYALAGVVGFLSPTLFGLAPAVGLLLDAPDNASHIVLGGYGAVVGLLALRSGR